MSDPSAPDSAGAESPSPESPSPESPSPGSPSPGSPSPKSPSPGAGGKRPRLTRRKLLGLFALGGLGAYGLKKLAVVDQPPKLQTLKLSPAAEALIEESFAGIDERRLLDSHVHLIGLGVGGTGCFVHPGATSLTSPVRWLKTRFYKGAAGVYDDARADPLFLERLLDLVRHHRGRFLLFAFDQHYTAAGEPDLDSTEFHTPNDYTLETAAKYPQHFLACASVHPYRADALEELRRCRERGAVAVKWLPNAMGIDPAAERCDAYYALLKQLDLTLITHAGEEQAVHAEEAQELGNPLRLRRALRAGVRVVVAHCASLGQNEDLDQPADAEGKHPRVDSYQLFRRLAAEPEWEGRLFADVSAMTQYNRCGAPLRETIATPALHPLLINGSDYPLPAIDPLIRTGLLVDEGYLDPAERVLINEVYDYNPLLFDFVLKRRLRVLREGKEHRLPAAVFESARAFPLVS